MLRAGLPTTTSPAATDFTTTAPAPDSGACPDLNGTNYRSIGANLYSITQDRTRLTRTAVTDSHTVLQDDTRADNSVIVYHKTVAMIDGESGPNQRFGVGVLIREQILSKIGMPLLAVAKNAAAG